MRRLLILTAVATSASFIGLGCGGDNGGDATGPSPSYENIAGTYAGPYVGTVQGIVLDATFTLTITQNRGSLGGSYSLVGTLNDGVQVVPVQGTGTISGTIEAGDNPSVNVTATSGVCPNVQSAFSGTYDSANRRITVSGPVKIRNDACQVVLTYPSFFILSR